MKALEIPKDPTREANLQVTENNMQSAAYRGGSGLNLKSIIGASSDILQSLQEDKKAEEEGQNKIKDDEDQLRQDFQALDDDYEVKSHDFAEAFLHK